MINIRTLNAADATELLRSMGMKISPEILRLGIEQKVFPFGVVIRTPNDTPRTIIFERQLMEWAKTAGEEVQ